MRRRIMRKRRQIRIRGITEVRGRRGIRGIGGRRGRRRGRRRGIRGTGEIRGRRGRRGRKGEEEEGGGDDDDDDDDEVLRLAGGMRRAKGGLVAGEGPGRCAQGSNALSIASSLIGKLGLLATPIVRKTSRGHGHGETLFFGKL